MGKRKRKGEGEVIHGNLEGRKERKKVKAMNSIFFEEVRVEG